MLKIPLGRIEHRDQTCEVDENSNRRNDERDQDLNLYGTRFTCLLPKKDLTWPF